MRTPSRQFTCTLVLTLAALFSLVHLAHAQPASSISASQRFTVTVTVTVPFTDDPLVPGVTPIKAVHFTELRARIDEVLVAAGLEPFSWTDPVLTAGVTPVRRQHLDEMRAMLNVASDRTGQARPRWTDPVSVRGTTPIKAVHLMELRAALMALPATPTDFSGQVLTPVYMRPRSNSVPVQGVSVTIVAGPRAGEHTETDHDGRYTFSELDGDELHIRLEKYGHETKEAIVHRTRATTLSDRVPLGYNGPQDRPGTVLVGLSWPEYAERVMAQMSVVADLLLISAEGSYGWGVVAVRDPSVPDPSDSPLMHELCHAHQHAVVKPRGGGSGQGTGWHPDWFSSPEVQAYLEAREADRSDIGHNPISVLPGQDMWDDSELVVLEENTEFCAHWWGVGYRRYDVSYWRQWLQNGAPNRARWLRDWLTRRP